MLVMAPFIVLDQNALRKPELLGPAIERARLTRVQLLILDVAVLEMMKHPTKWEETSRGSLAGLAACAGLVSVGRGVPDLMKEERDSGVPAIASLVDRELTPPFRALLLEFQNAAGGSHLDYLRSKILDTQQRIIEAQYLQHEDNKRMLLGFRDVWKEVLPHAADRRRAGGNVQDRLALLAHPTLTRTLEQILISHGHSVRMAQRVALDRSVSAHWMLSLLAIAFRWFVDQGLDNLPAVKATNEVIDVDYITIGSLCSELISRETNVNETLAFVRGAAEIRSSVFEAVDVELPHADADTRFRRHCEITPKT